jgi:predicted TIM-barrel fold metal-dependent hydrolase
LFTIDFHAHPFAFKELLEKDRTLLDNIKHVYNLLPIVQPLQSFIDSMDEVSIAKTVLVAIDCETARGCKLPSNEVLAEVIKLNPDRFIAFASVDPRKGDKAIDDLEYAINTLKFKGLKLYPSLQEFYPNDKRNYVLYERVQDLNIPILFHSGVSLSSGKDRFSQLIYFDDVAVDFPDIKIVLAHLGWPWIMEALSLAIKHENIFLDLSGLPSGLGLPKEHFQFLFRSAPLQLFERCLKDKIIFGSDFPRADPNSMAKALSEISLPSDVKQLLLGGNAAKLLNIV